MFNIHTNKKLTENFCHEAVSLVLMCFRPHLSGMAEETYGQL